MRVELETEYATPEIIAHVGEIVDLPENVARDLIQKRFAIPAAADKVAPRRRDAPDLIVGEIGEPDDRWEDPIVFAERIEREEFLGVAWNGNGDDPHESAQ
jgi:hypothetical protein